MISNKYVVLSLTLILALSSVTVGCKKDKAEGKISPVGTEEIYRQEKTPGGLCMGLFPDSPERRQGENLGG